MNPKKELKKILSKHTFLLILMSLVSLAFTLYILLNAYEQVFFQDIKYLQTLRSFQHTEEISKLTQQVFSNKQEVGDQYQISTDNIRFMEIPSINATIELTKELYKNEVWYLRGNKAHIIRNDNSHNLIIYFDETWRTTQEIRTLKKDSFIYFNSNKYIYLYKVESINTNISDFKLPTSETDIPRIYVISENNDYQIITLILVNSSIR